MKAQESQSLEEKKRTKILIIEDEADISELIHYNLAKEGYEVSVAQDGKEGLRLALEQIPHLILLDIMLPHMDGFTVCKHLRDHEKTQNIPIIILTAKGEETDTVHGLDLGADDYMIKPFRTSELSARVKAHLRRYAAYRQAMSEEAGGLKSSKELKRWGPLALDEKRHMIFLEENPLILTLSEFKLLATLMSSPGCVYTRSELIGHIAGEGVHLVERNIDVHVLSLRKKLGEHASLIQTIRGVGYKIAS